MTCGEQVHALHPMSAWVWQRCDGTRSVAELAAQVSEALDIDADETLVWSALDGLAQAGLLEAHDAPLGGVQRLSRRALVRRVVAAAASVAVVSTVAPAIARAETPADRAAEVLKKLAGSADEEHADAEQRRKHREAADERAAKEQEENAKKQAHHAEERRKNGS